MSTDRVRRFDYASSGKLAPPKRLDNGFLKAEGRIARVGIQIYRDANGGERRELRLPEEVFDQESLDSFEQMPLTNNHPSKMLDAANAKAHAIGNVGKLRRDGDFVAASILVTDAEAIKAAEAGRSQLSNGYSCTLDATQDPELTEKWGAYDSIQRDIRGNHVALVDTARAGEEARMRLDAGDAACFLSPEETVVGSKPLQEIVKMAHALKIDGMSFEIQDANAQAVVDRAIAAAKKSSEDLAVAAQKRADAIELERDALKKDLSSLQAAHDVLKADAEKMTKCDECGGTGKIDSAECKGCSGKGEHPVKMDRADSIQRRIDRGIKTAVKSRVALEVQGRKHLGVNVKIDDMTDLELKRAVAVKLNPGCKTQLEARKDDDVYVTAIFDNETARHDATAPRAIDKVRTVQDPVTTTTEPAKNTDNMDAAEARELMIQRQRAANVKFKK